MKLFLIVLLFICSFVIGNSIEKINFGIDSAKNGMYKKIVAQKSPVAVATPLSKMENPRIVIKKEKRRLELFDGEKLIKTYTVALGFAPTGDKEKQGDGKTPEGEFYIFTKNNQSKFYLSLGVSYPNIEDAHRGLEAKTITKNQYAKIVNAFNAKKAPPQNTKLGGDIYIHGGGTERDWTWGCVALDNKNIKELFDTIPVGASVKIEP